MQGYTYFFPIAYATTDVAIYQQDVVIHRSEGTSYEETVGDLKVWHVYVGNRCKSDYGDVRFTDANGAELAYYLWPDYDAESARFCVRLEGADAAGVLQVWYGNPSATTTSDGDATYAFFDHFDGDALDMSTWSLYPGASVSVANGRATISAYGAYAQGTYLDAEQYILESKITSISSGKIGYVGWEYPFGLSHTRWAQFGKFSDDQGEVYIRKTGSSSSTRITFSWANDKVYRLILDNTAKKTYLYAGNTPVINGVDYSANDIADPMGIMIGHPGFSSIAMSVDYILVRAYSATPPAATAFGPEQVPGTLHHVVFGSANMMVI